jgi:hypothetical protein
MLCKEFFLVSRNSHGRNGREAKDAEYATRSEKGGGASVDPVRLASRNLGREIVPAGQPTGASQAVMEEGWTPGKVLAVTGWGEGILLGCA